MTEFTTISPALVAVGAKPFATTMQALRDNPIAIAEGDPTAVAAGHTIRDAALNTGPATGAGVTWVGLRIGGLSADAVGTYAMLYDNDSGAGTITRTFGQLLAGSGLQPVNASGAAFSGTVSGTWRCMGRCLSGASTPTSSPQRVTLWLRVA